MSRTGDAELCFSEPQAGWDEMPLAPAAAGPYAAKARRRASLANQLLSALSQNVIGIVLDEISYEENTTTRKCQACMLESRCQWGRMPPATNRCVSLPAGAMEGLPAQTHNHGLPAYTTCCSARHARQPRKGHTTQLQSAYYAACHQGPPSPERAPAERPARGLAAAAAATCSTSARSKSTPMPHSAPNRFCVSSLPSSLS